MFINLSSPGVDNIIKQHVMFKYIINNFILTISNKNNY